LLQDFKVTKPANAKLESIKNKKTQRAMVDISEKAGLKSFSTRSLF